MSWEWEFDVVIVVHRIDWIFEIDGANIKCLARMDRMGIGIDRSRLHFQMRTASSS